MSSPLVPLSESEVVSNHSVNKEACCTLALQYKPEQAQGIAQPAAKPKRSALSPMPERPPLMLMPPAQHTDAHKSMATATFKEVTGIRFFLTCTVKLAVCLLALLGAATMANNGQTIPGFSHAALWSQSLQNELEVKTLRIQSLEAQLAGCV